MSEQAIGTGELAQAISEMAGDARQLEQKSEQLSAALAAHELTLAEVFPITWAMARTLAAIELLTVFACDAVAGRERAERWRSELASQPGSSWDDPALMLEEAGERFAAAAGLLEELYERARSEALWALGEQAEALDDQALARMLLIWRAR